MKKITEKQKQELNMRLDELKKKHPKLFGTCEFFYSDLGLRVRLIMKHKGGGISEITDFMSSEAMWFVLHYIVYPVMEKASSEIKFYNSLKQNNYAQ